MKNNLQTKDTVLLGLFISLKIILARVAQITLFNNFLRISFGFIVSGLTAYLYGPWITCAMGAAADILGFFLFPQTSPFFPGYTLTAALGGFTYGYFMHYKKMKGKISLPHIVMANAFVNLILHGLLNTYWLSLTNGKAFMALLPLRLAKNFAIIPIECAILYFTLKYLTIHLNAFRTKEV
ncbi:ECF transporter S component [Sporanaerobium hydrogeniformans]|uniref:ECF transporter S component n=1 Tax=Sporanaerobium hydrogeniformans TaxID=3072179 RepID=A0AC61DG22_9FIRM|nr:folate family ECF transporter S component [Sporanaerobium hydrogeniformans]PHV71988.1 ECF transporter S component [Sporanaerobium hydrogeniformans]